MRNQSFNVRVKREIFVKHLLARFQGLLDFRCLLRGKFKGIRFGDPGFSTSDSSVTKRKN